MSALTEAGREPEYKGGPSSVSALDGYNPLMHKWIKAPKKLYATFICRRCGVTSMVKHYGRCSKA